jgi:hypothetical protein
VGRREHARHGTLSVDVMANRSQDDVLMRACLVLMRACTQAMLEVSPGYIPIKIIFGWLMSFNRFLCLTVELRI